MDLTLNRKMFREDGIFGELTGNGGSFFLVTLEHAYPSNPNPDGSVEINYQPKVKAGKYLCRRSMHRLHGMDHDFETFEVTGVPDFEGKPVSGILFHWGNYNNDSEGCMLLGQSVGARYPSGKMIVCKSEHEGWKLLMATQAGIDSFYLTVED